MHAGVVIFALTYALISARRLQWLGLDRPAGALLGAVACVASGVLSPDAALAAVDGATLLLLFGVMGMGAFLALDGFFDAVERWLIAWARTPQRLLGAVVWGAGTLSALITNDAVCVLGAPLLVRLIQRQRLPALPYLLALATAANTGSVATLVGNPQNILCGLLGGLDYAGYLARLGPLALAALGLNHALLWRLFRRELAAGPLEAGEAPQPLPVRARATLAMIGATVLGYTLGGHLAWTATGGFVALMMIHRRDTRQLWPHIDGSLLVFFAALFVVVEGLEASGAPAALFERYPLWSGAAEPAPGADPTAHWVAYARVAALFLLGSNLVSNVPFILLVQEPLGALPDPRLGWELLAMASTFAGNLTLLGSVANVIVAEAGREVGGLPFWQYLRVGLPLALATTALGTAWLLLVG